MGKNSTEMHRFSVLLFLAVALVGVCEALFIPATNQNTCSHLVNGSLTCCKTDADCSGCDSEYCACWACGADGTDVIDGRSYNCDSCAAPSPTPPAHRHPNICQHLVNGSLACCNNDGDCGDEGGMCWACPGGSSYVDGVKYNCDTCAAPSPTPPRSYPNICQHLVNDTLACCKTDADCGDEGGTCWACPDGSSWVDHKYFKCDTCQATPPTPPAPPTPPTPPTQCDWASEVLSCSADATCSACTASHCASSQAVVSYCRMDNNVCHFHGN